MAAALTLAVAFAGALALAAAVGRSVAKLGSGRRASTAGAATPVRVHRARPSFSGMLVMVAGLGALALTVPLIVTAGPQNPGAGTAEVAAARDTSGSAHVHAAPGTAAGDAVSTGQIISLEDPRLSAVERSRATALLASTRGALASFPDEASVLAAGYRSIGDGRAPGSFEHYVNLAYLADGRDLDPTRIESVVLQHEPGGTKKVVSAMYILEPGSTLVSVPDIAGSLTTWHDHQNLCWDDSGLRLAGIVVNGKCSPGGTFHPTPPMLHVWLEDTPCGPFAGIEGHGGACTHTHA